MYIVARVFYGKPFKARCSSSYLDGLIHALALMALGSILSVIVWFMLFGFNMDINTIFASKTRICKLMLSSYICINFLGN